MYLTLKSENALENAYPTGVGVSIGCVGRGDVFSWAGRMGWGVWVGVRWGEMG